MTAAEQGLFIY